MKLLMELCGIFNPFLILFFGLLAIFYVIFHFLHELKLSRKIAKIYDASSFTSVTGRIIEYEYEEKEKIIEKDGKHIKTMITYAYPIVEYRHNDEIKRYVYKTSFKRQFKENIGFEFQMYIDPNNNEPYVNFDDIYANEIQITKIIMAVISVIILILSVTMACCSAYVNFAK